MSKAVKQKTDNQLQSLLDTVERLRHDKFPQLDSTLVREILRIHADVATTDADLTRGVEQAIERHLPKER